MKIVKEVIKTLALIIAVGVVAIGLFIMLALSYRHPVDHNPKVQEAIQKYNHTIRYDNQDK